MPPDGVLKLPEVAKPAGEAVELIPMAGASMVPVQGPPKTTRERIIACVEASDQPMTSVDIADSLGLSVTTVQPILKDCVSEKKLRISHKARVGKMGRESLFYFGMKKELPVLVKTRG